MIDPELDAIATFPIVHLFWLLVDFMMKEAIGCQKPLLSPRCPEKERVQRQQQLKNSYVLSPLTSEHRRETMQERTESWARW